MSLRSHASEHCAKAAPCCAPAEEVNRLAKVLAAGIEFRPPLATTRAPMPRQPMRVDVGAPASKPADTHNDLLYLPIELKDVILKLLKSKDTSYSQLYRAVYAFCNTTNEACPLKTWERIVKDVFNIEKTSNPWKAVANMNGMLHFGRINFFNDHRFAVIAEYITKYSDVTLNTDMYLEYCLAAYNRLQRDTQDRNIWGTASDVGPNASVMKYVPAKRPDYAQIAKIMVEKHQNEFAGVQVEHAAFGDIFLSAVKHWPIVMTFYNASIITDNLALEAVKINPMAFEYVKQHRPLYQEIALAVAEHPEFDGVFLKLVERWPQIMSFYNMSIITDKLALKAVEINPIAFQYVPSSRPNYTKIALAVAERMPDFVLLTISDGRFDDRMQEVAIEAVKRSPTALYFFRASAMNTLHDVEDVYFEVCMEAVKHFNADAFKDINANSFSTTSRYAEIALAAIETNGRVLAYIDKSYVDYFSIASKAIAKNPSLFTYADIGPNATVASKKIREDYSKLRGLRNWHICRLKVIPFVRATR
jgi:hypothetical protein